MMPVWPGLLAQVTAPSVTYTPIRRPGDDLAPALPPPAAPPPRLAPAVPPAWSPPQTVYVPIVPAAPAAPTPAASAVPVVPVVAASASPAAMAAPSLSASAADPGASTTLAQRALPRASHARGIFGLAMDLGMPDGLNLGPVLAPAPWIRFGASAGSNSAGFDYRGSLSFLPVGFGPSFTFELGHSTMADMNGLLGTFFSVSGWIKPYVQQLGYTYFNAHLGVEYPVGNVMLFLHGGYTYLAGTVRGQTPVVVSRNSDQTPNTTVLAQDGDVHAHTLSAKLGAVLMFGGI